MTTTTEHNGHPVDTLQEDTTTAPLPEQSTAEPEPEPTANPAAPDGEQPQRFTTTPASTRPRPRRGRWLTRGRRAAVDDPIDPDELQARIDRDQEVVAKQDTAVLREAKTRGEINAEAAQQRRHRADERTQDEHDHQARMTRRKQRRQRENRSATKHEKHEDRIADLDQRREQQQKEAEANRERMLDPTEQLRQADQHRRTVPKLMLVPSLLATLTSAVNLAVQGARVIDPAPAGGLLGLGADLVCTIAMTSLLIARMVGLAELTTGGKQQRKPKLGWFTLGDLAVGAVLVALNVIGHSLPSADGTPHDPSTGLLFIFLAGGFVFSSVFAPMTQRLLNARFAEAAAAVQRHTLAARLDAESDRVAHDVAVDVRTAKLLLEIDEHEGLGGERGEDGLPSSNKIYEAMRRHVGRGNQESARRMRELMQLVGGKHYDQS